MLNVTGTMFNVVWSTDSTQLYSANNPFPVESWIINWITSRMSQYHLSLDTWEIDNLMSSLGPLQSLSPSKIVKPLSKSQIQSLKILTKG